jgi:hypothetical protein
VETEFETCSVKIVPKATFKVLMKSGKYDLRSNGCAMRYERLPDGRDLILVLDTVFKQWEAAERHVGEQEVSDAAIAQLDELPEVKPVPQATDSIPAGDRALGERLFGAKTAGSSGQQPETKLVS